MDRFINSLILRLRSGDAVCWLILINVAAWIAVTIASASGFQAAARLAMPGDLHAFARAPWTMITYMFTQLSFLHMLFNMIWLLWFGMLLDAPRNSRLIWILYIAGGIMGALAYLGASAFPEIGAKGSLIGASAAVMSVIAATAVIKGNIKLRLIIFGQVRLKWIALAAIALSMTGVSAASGMSHAAGALAGVAAGLFTLRPAKEKYQPRPQITVKTPLRNGVLTAEADSARLDELLDKIRISGFKSLSASERTELLSISKNISTR